MSTAPSTIDIPVRSGPIRPGVSLSLSAHTPSAEVLPPLSAHDQSNLMLWDEQLRTVSIAINTASCVIAYYGWRMKKSARWGEFGCQSEIEYATKRKIPYNTWRKYVRIGRVLEALSFDALVEIGITRALYLTKVNPDIWPDYDWLKEARKLPSSRFSQLVQERNRSVSGGESDIDTQRKHTRRVNRAKLKSISTEHGLGSIDKALQFVLTDTHNSGDVHANLFAAAKHTRKLLMLAAKTLRIRHSIQDREAHRLILKARQRISDAINAVVQKAVAGGDNSSSGEAVTS